MSSPSAAEYFYDNIGYTDEGARLKIMLGEFQERVRDRRGGSAWN